MNDEWREHMKRIGKKGGTAKWKRYGKKEYSKMGKLGVSKKKKKKPPHE